MKNKMSIKVLFGIIFGVAMVVLFQQYIIPDLFTPSIDTQLNHLASEMNKNCPMMVDSQTRMDNTMAGSDKSIIYNYTLINYAKDQVDLKFFNNKLRPKILNNIKTNPQMNYLKNRDVTFVYNYNDKNGIFIISLKITPKEYKN